MSTDRIAKALCLSALFFAAAGPVRADSKLSAIARADLHYRQQSYGAALSEYRAAVAAGQVTAVRTNEVRYRIVVSLGRTHQWDRALAENLQFIKDHRGGIWEARGLYQLGRQYLASPSSGYRVGGVVLRGANVPGVPSKSSEKPRLVSLVEQDRRDAREALEAAHVVYERFHTHETRAEEIQLDFDLAHLLYSDPRYAAWQAKIISWPAPGDLSLSIKPDEPYSLDWAPPKKILALYTNIRRIAGPTAHSTALSLLDEALWLRSYQTTMRGQYAFRYVGHKAEPIRFPYDRWDPFERLRRIVRDFPRDPIYEQIRFLVASLLDQDASYKAAEVEYRRLIADRPKSKWVTDSRAALATMSHRQVTFSTPPIYLPGRPTDLEISSRNVSAVKLKLYRVDLPLWVLRSDRLSDPTLSLTDTASVAGIRKELMRKVGKPASEWTVRTHDRGDHVPISTKITLPIHRDGAYVLIGAAPGVQAVTLLTRSDIVVVQKIERDSALYFATEALTGSPIKGAHILAREVYGLTNTKGDWVQQVAVLRGTTGPDGTVSLPIARKAGRNSFEVSAFGWYGSSCAITSQSPWGEWDDNQGRFKTYGTTDRSVYRPLQMVQFRQLVMERQLGGMKPATGRTIHVEATDPKGRRIYAALLRAGEFGSVNGRFELPADAPLGEYSVQCSVYKVEDAATDNGGSRFRVEEYKKPEFEVTVLPDAARVRLGEPTTARVVARYYFGGPAANAKVSYRVYRNAYVQSYRFPQPFDFLYNHSDPGGYDTSYRNGEVVAQGSARTDDKGEAKITFETRADGARWIGQDLSYTIDADVKDSSRRTISGTGVVKATRHDVGVFVNYSHGYAHVGDRISAEVMSINASDVPVAVEGVAKVFRQPTDPKAKERLVVEMPLATDSHGRAMLDWTADHGGYYRIAFVTRDSAGQDVEGSTFLWVEGLELAQGQFLSQGIVMEVEQPYYQEGQTARLLITTVAPGCTVLVTREVNNQILGKRLVHISERSAEISVPLEHRDVPNVFISAVMVHNGQLHETSKELFVPPVSRLARLTVTPDKLNYQPGEKAHLSLAATDWQNRPLRTELAVSISDAALSYIQKDYSQDIRVYFYGDRRSVSVSSAGSTGTQFSQSGEDTQPTVVLQPHTWVMPDGMGLLAIPHYGRPVALFRPIGMISNLRLQDFDEVSRSGVSGPRSRRQASPTLFSALRNRTVYDHAPDEILAGGTFGVGQSKAGATVNGSTTPSKREFERAGQPRDSLTHSLPASAGEGDDPVRRKFLDTAFWTPAVVTDAEGKAGVDVTWPDNLTQWRASTVGNSAEAQVGTADATITTRKDILVRLETPRYFVERDTMTVTVIVQNGAEADAHVHVGLNLEGDALEVIAEPATGGTGLGTAATQHELWIDVPKEGEKRVDWKVRVRHPGSVRVMASARADAGGDATQTDIPVLVNGVERALASSGVLRGGSGRATIPVNLPEARKRGTSEVVVQLSPSLAAVMLDALPYLNGYPYGCIEQTMSRFLPSIITARVLRDQGYLLEDLRTRALSLQAEARAGRGALKIDSSPYSYPAGKPGTEPAPIDRSENPVFDSATLRKMTAAGMARIRQYQHPDGGWGWWKDDATDTWMTAYVVYGLIQAREAGTPFDAGRLRRAEDLLQRRFREDDDLHRMTYVARVLAIEPAYRSAIRAVVAQRLYNGREKLGAYSKALLALALSSLGERAKAAVMIGNLENTVQIDEAEGTAHWGDDSANWWCWYNEPVETNAAVLQAYLVAAPHSRLEPMIVKWLVNHRVGENWATTRETALTVYALSDYIRATKELSPDYTLSVDMAGRVNRTYHVTRENALLFDNRFVVPDSLLQTGAQPVTISKVGTGACYYNVYTRFFSQEDSIPESGNGIFVSRRYFRLRPDTASGAPPEAAVDFDRPNPFLSGQYELVNEMGTDIDQEDTNAGPRYERTALNDGDTITSGDMVEVELSLEAKNDYEYLALEDVKPAGFEPTEVRSGEKAGQGIYSNFELRDQKVVFFVSNIPQGKRTLSYRLRAEAPGAFHALPTNGYAMYAPALRALSAERTINVKDD